jgi:hypothetical protein
MRFATRLERSTFTLALILHPIPLRYDEHLNCMKSIFIDEV